MLTQTSTGFLIALFVTTSLFPHRAQAQDLSATEILKKVAETYHQVAGFSLVAEKKVDLDTNLQGVADNPHGTVTGSHESNFIEVTLITANSSKAKLSLKDGKKEIVVISDGKLVGTLLTAQHEYTVVQSNSEASHTPVYIPGIGSNDISGVGLLLEYEFLAATGFRAIARYEASAKLDHPDTLKVGKDKKECYVLTIQMAAGSEKLWVDKKEFIVWKSERTSVGPWTPPGATLKTTITLTIKQMALNPTLDDSNFIFTPPSQAKKVDSLKLSGTNPF